MWINQQVQNLHLGPQDILANRVQLYYEKRTLHLPISCGMFSYKRGSLYDPY